jgi:hypothetical protein
MISKGIDFPFPVFCVNKEARLLKRIDHMLKV